MYRDGQGWRVKSKKGLLFLGITAAVVFLAACGGEPAPTPTKVSSRATQIAPVEPSPTPTEPTVTVTAAPAGTPGTFPLPLTPPRPTLSPAATAPRPTRTATPSPPPPTPTRLSEDSASKTEDIEDIRRIVSEYWQALNDYDVDQAVTMLEPAYRAAEEELIRKDIGRMKLFRVKLKVSEETPPTLNEDGEYETYLSLKTPVDTRRALMVFRQIDGGWWIVFSGEVE